MYVRMLGYSKFEMWKFYIVVPYDNLRLIVASYLTLNKFSMSGTHSDVDSLTNSSSLYYHISNLYTWIKVHGSWTSWECPCLLCRVYPLCCIYGQYLFFFVYVPLFSHSSGLPICNELDIYQHVLAKKLFCHTLYMGDK